MTRSRIAVTCSPLSCSSFLSSPILLQCLEEMLEQRGKATLLWTGWTSTRITPAYQRLRKFGRWCCLTSLSTSCGHVHKSWTGPMACREATLSSKFPLMCYELPGAGHLTPLAFGSMSFTTRSDRRFESPHRKLHPTVLSIRSLRVARILLEHGQIQTFGMTTSWLQSIELLYTTT